MARRLDDVMRAFWKGEEMSQADLEIAGADNGDRSPCVPSMRSPRGGREKRHGYMNAHRKNAGNIYERSCIRPVKRSNFNVNEGVMARGQTLDLRQLARLVWQSGDRPYGCHSGGRNRQPEDGSSRLFQQARGPARIYRAE